MATVAQILNGKPDQAVHIIAPGATVFEAISLLAEKNIGALPVVSEGKVVGVFTERNYARHVALAGRSSKDTTVAEIMDKEAWEVHPGQSREECMVLMNRQRVRHLVVTEAGRLVGLVSIGDLVKNTIDEQRFVIEQLEHYIAGDRGLA
jgi:CBS domain-containing protein